MSLWTSLEPASATVDPGSTTRVRLRVRNTGDVVDEYRFEPFGDVAPWTRIEPQTLRLYPGAVAGPNPYAVRITPTEHPDAVTVPEDNGDHLSYEIRPANVQIEPGRAAFVETTLKPKQKIWFGSKAYKPQVASKATEQTEEAGAALPPSPSATPETLPSSPESAPADDPQPEPSASDADGNGGGGGDGDGGGGGGDKPKKKSVLPAIDVMLFNPTTKMCADIPGREKGKIGGPVQQANCHPTGDNERWNLEVKYEKGGGPDSTPLFQIRNTTDKLCMDMELRGARPVGTPIIEATCTGTKADNQLWWLDKQESGDYWIRNYSSNNKCLNVSGKSFHQVPRGTQYCPEVR
ncbi:RICIN domain-containing protein [Streptomyces olivaceus]|uniref:RICIN domain-containing protein n=1 Tax=Streptomyces olivaceus TaxID=47716 RepID=UPI00099D7A06|nr:RICIN domain-containing protein [Streptomyces olivaceus]